MRDIARTLRQIDILIRNLFPAKALLRPVAPLKKLSIDSLDFSITDCLSVKPIVELRPKLIMGENKVDIRQALPAIVAPIMVKPINIIGSRTAQPRLLVNKNR